MTNLTSEQKDVILNFYFRCGDPAEIDRARDLIASDKRAAELYSHLQQTLTQLDAVKYEPCPDNLADLTIARLKAAAAVDRIEMVEQPLKTQSEIDRLLAQERQKDAETSTKTLKPNFTLWRFAEIGAVAALLFIGINMMFPVFSNMRSKSWQAACASNLKSIAMGMSNYQQANDSFMPYVATEDDAPWWKVGDQGMQNQSNTRHYWLLVKGDYTEGSDFICPGKKGSTAANTKDQGVLDSCDFPSRKNVNYSFALVPQNASARKRADSVSVIMADLNPVFEGITTKFDQRLFGKIALNDQMRQMTSTNHGQSGQNVLIHDGSASFNERRFILNDDIYTLMGRNSYSGNERPAIKGDTFLVP